MSFLPTIATLLIIFSLATHTLFFSSFTTCTLHSSYSGNFSAHRKTLSEYEKEKYQKIRKRPSKSKNSPSKQNHSNKTGSHSQRNPSKKYKENFQLNIFPLLTSGKEQNADLYLLVTELIYITYGKRDFYRAISQSKDLSCRLIDQWIKVSKDKINLVPIEKTDFNDPAMQFVFYKMLKRNKKNDPSQDVVPSLCELLMIKNCNNQQKIPLYSAPRSLLAVLFNENLAEKIHQIRQNRELVLTEELLQDLCSKACYRQKFPNLWEMIDFSSHHKYENTQIICGTDDKSKISIVRTLYP